MTNYDFCLLLFSCYWRCQIICIKITGICDKYYRLFFHRYVSTFRVVFETLLNIWGGAFLQKRLTGKSFLLFLQKKINLRWVSEDSLLTGFWGRISLNFFGEKQSLILNLNFGWKSAKFLREEKIVLQEKSPEICEFKLVFQICLL